MVEEAWNSFNVQGKKMFILKEILKLLKYKPKSWNYVVFGILDIGNQEAVKDLNKLDQLLGNNDIPFSSDTVEKRSQSQPLVWQKLHFREPIIRQKSKCRWIKESDQNSNLFHSFRKSRFRRSGIVALRSGDGLIEEEKVSNLLFSTISNQDSKSQIRGGLYWKNSLSTNYTLKIIITLKHVFP